MQSLLLCSCLTLQTCSGKLPMNWNFSNLWIILLCSSRTPVLLNHAKTVLVKTPPKYRSVYKNGLSGIFNSCDADCMAIAFIIRRDWCDFSRQLPVLHLKMFSGLPFAIVLRSQSCWNKFHVCCLSLSRTSCAAKRAFNMTCLQQNSC